MRMLGNPYNSQCLSNTVSVSQTNNGGKVYIHQLFIVGTKTCMTVNVFFIFMVLCIVSILIRSNKMQQYAGIYLLQIYSTCFRCPSHPS